MPRPGASVPVAFASATRVNADPDLLEAFITKALGFEVGDPVFISDESSIDHFGDEERVEEIRQNIREHFGVTLEPSASLRIADVLERIRARA
jgi:hypothetical protein